MADQHQHYTPRPQQPRQEPPKPEARPEVSAASPEKIVTKAASPAEVFDAKLTDLVYKVLRGEMKPHESIQELHNFWKNNFTVEERDQLVNPDTVGSIHEVGQKLMRAANMLGQEMPALVATHGAMKGVY